MEELINITVLAFRKIITPRYYRTERGFVTEFYKHLSNEIENSDLFPEGTILEAEVQKREDDHYGVTQRPDILIHIPIESGLTENANENNFVVYAFKLNANNGRVDADFVKLEEMFDSLNYGIGFFINIGAHPRTYLYRYNGNYRNRINEFTIGLTNGQVSINHSYFIGAEIRTVVK